MSQRVSAAISESLLARLQPVKHHFNISTICQEALEMAITYEELKLQVAEDDNLVERLQAEKKVLLNKVRQEGFELGIRASAKLSYLDFRHFERVQPLAVALDDEVLDYLWTFLDLKDYPASARLNDPNFAYVLEADPQSRITFAQGWMDGVLSVWQTIKTQADNAQ